MNSIYEITYILSLIYGFLLSYFKYKYRAKSHSFKIKNTENGPEPNAKINFIPYTTP